MAVAPLPLVPPFPATPAPTLLAFCPKAQWRETGAPFSAAPVRPWPSLERWPVCSCSAQEAGSPKQPSSLQQSGQNRRPGCISRRVSVVPCRVRLPYRPAVGAPGGGVWRAWALSPGLGLCSMLSPVCLTVL